MITYRKDMAKYYKPLSPEQQVKAYESYKGGDEKARDAIICSCLPLAYSLAGTFASHNSHIDFEDLASQANLALISAVDAWDYRRSRITTFATHYIKNELRNMVKDSNYKITTVYNLTRFAISDLKRIKKLNTNDVEEIVKQTGIKAKRVKILLRVASSSRERAPKLINLHPEEINIDNRESLSVMHKLIDQLPPLDRQLIKMTYLEGETIKAACKKLGKHQDWARRTRAKTLERLKVALTEQGIDHA